MKKLAVFACAAFAGGLMLMQTAQASVPVDRSRLKPMFITLPARGVSANMLRAQARAAAPATIPFFTSKVTSPVDGNTYEFHIMGTNPTAEKVSTTVHYVPIMLRIHFPDGTVLDPTKPGCNDTVSVQQRFFGSPLFNPTALTSNGIAVGNTQIIDAFQRAEFWQYVKGTGYHVLLAAVAQPRLIDVTAPRSSLTADVGCGTAHNLGLISIADYDNVLVSVTNKYATVNQVPVIMSYNVVLTFGPPDPKFSNCCVIGYHSAYLRGRNGIQTYANGAYVDHGIFGVTSKTFTLGRTNSASCSTIRSAGTRLRRGVTSARCSTVRIIWKSAIH
ncbi:MAG: hypothetical protein GIX03_03450 [Candidatus Eremiobacteraeota bacterium]|nr:hypothetical protein [Candidatus Eremiobacteraeota bacterium]MBC5802069.1 hypothetical protein [Candidatus Eremiobacteraeota bacterium]MBC5822693.1 hypothetical protein [Candidatus Eremiobacteraeota bacterium]